jgi:chemotaxis protein MotC
VKRKTLIFAGAAMVVMLAASGAAGLLLWPEALGWLNQGKPALPETAMPTDSLSKTGDATSHDQSGAAASAEAQDQEGTLQAGKAKTELRPAQEFLLPRTARSPIIAAMKDITSQQSALAFGDKAAGARLRKAMLDMQAEISASTRQELMPGEVEAIALYILSGGNPLAVGKVLQRPNLTEQQTQLLSGAIAFSKADFAAARPALEKLETEKLQPLLAAQLNMALAQLTAEDDVNAIVRKLSSAANLAPGTLIEEAAMRRILAHVSKQKHPQHFLYWSNRYLRRFSSSLYAEDFERPFLHGANAFGAMWSHVTAEDLAILFYNAGADRTNSFATAILLAAIGLADTETCARVDAALRLGHPLDAVKSGSLQALIDSCAAGRMDDAGFEALQAIDAAALSPDAERLVQQARSMVETVTQQGVDAAASLIGPAQPATLDTDSAAIVASVAQQLNATMAVINRANGHETDPIRSP